MSLDDLIDALTEAREHCIDGRSEVILQHRPTKSNNVMIYDVQYDSKNVYIVYE